MIKVTYEYKGEYIEEECETPLETAILKDSLEINPDINNIKTLYD